MILYYRAHKIQNLVKSPSKKFSVLVLGGYGNFGKRIVKEIAKSVNFNVIVAGRHIEQAKNLCDSLVASNSKSQLTAYQIDLNDSQFSDTLRHLQVDALVHTCGPFQAQDYRVAQAAINAGVHYIDLADGREFVTGITQLDSAAREKNVLVVSGASTVPGLSAAVVDYLQPHFAQIEGIDVGIAPGNRTERGLGTIQAILSYTGKPFLTWENGKWKQVFGWQSLRSHHYSAPAGQRWLANCDIPDLLLFADRYKGIRTVTFGAGLELSILHFGLWALSWLSRAGIIHNWRSYAALFKRLSDWFLRFGSDVGAMHITLRGQGHDGKPLTKTWELMAQSGHGPQIPCTAAVALLKKLAASQIAIRGARPCLDLFTLNEFFDELKNYNINTCIRE